MLAIARAMMNQPEAAAVRRAEPRSRADHHPGTVPHRSGALRDEFGMALLIVEQNAGLSLALADRAYVLETGTIVATGTGDELLADDTIKEAYLGVVS